MPRLWLRRAAREMRCRRRSSPAAIARPSPPGPKPAALRRSGTWRWRSGSVTWFGFRKTKQNPEKRSPDTLSNSLLQPVPSQLPIPAAAGAGIWTGSSANGQRCVIQGFVSISAVFDQADDPREVARQGVPRAEQRPLRSCGRPGAGTGPRRS